MTNTESRIQSDSFVWARNAHPEIHGCLFTVNNNPRNKVNGSLLKAMGLIKGVSDMLFLWKGKLYCFEFKTETGRQSAEQKRWEKQIKAQGAEYYVVRSVDEFKELFTCILNR